MPDVEKTLENATRTTALIDKLQTQGEAYDTLGGLVAELERKVRGYVMDYILHHKEDKKSSLEKLEIFACVDDAQCKCDYLELVFLRQKKNIAETVVESTRSALSGCKIINPIY